MKNKFILFLAAVVILGAIYAIFSRNSTATYPDDQADFIIFWGQGCPHCEVLKDEIAQNKWDQKLKFSLKEVYYNRQNQDLLKKTITDNCPDIPSDQVGVPMTFETATKRCFVGDTPAINRISERLSSESQ